MLISLQSLVSLYYLISNSVSHITACASDFLKYASDRGLLVPNGSYAITAGHCVQCSCGPRNLKYLATFVALSIRLLPFFFVYDHKSVFSFIDH